MRATRIPKRLKRHLQVAWFATALRERYPAAVHPIHSMTDSNLVATLAAAHQP